MSAFHFKVIIFLKKYVADFTCIYSLYFDFFLQSNEGKGLERSSPWPTWECIKEKMIAGKRKDMHESKQREWMKVKGSFANGHNYIS